MDEVRFIISHKFIKTEQKLESYYDFEVVSLTSLCFRTQEFMELEIERRRNTLKEE